MAIWVKICGLTTRDAVEAAVAASADAVGFVFAPSKRQVTASQAAQLAQGVPRRIPRVAVMLHPTQSQLDEVWSVFRPDVLQTDLEDLATLRVPMGLSVMPVIRGGVGLKPDLQERAVGPALAGHKRILFEGPVSGVGSTSDWHGAAQLARSTQLVLAGGLNATNVADAIAAVRPFGVDVSSGVEAAPGIKDPARIHEFVRRARAVSERSKQMSSAISIDPQASLARILKGEYPDARGRFGPFGGRYVPETLVPALDRLQAGVDRHLRDRAFLDEFHAELRSWVGRPTPLTHARTLSRRWGAEVWLKREDLAHTGAHKINNSVGQVLLAKKLGAKRVIAETGAGQHGVASAAACARLGMPCTVYMGSVDMERQAPNVGRMKLLGATVVPVTSGDQTLRAAVDEALRDWVSDPNGTYYCLGSAIGPHPYPYLVRELQAVIGREAREQIVDQTGKLPDIVIACVGGGSNAIGLFHPFIADREVQMLGLEAGGKGSGLGENAASLAYGTPGVLQGSYSLLLQDENGQIQETHSVSAGLDYPGVGPEHALLMSIGRVKYEAVDDDTSLAALAECCAAEGILPAIESAHALAGAKRYAAQHPGAKILIGLSGRGDKDMPTLQRTLLKDVQ